MRSQVRSSSLAVAALVLLTLIALGTSADASVVVPLADDELIAGADVIVLGRVTRITSHEDESGDISTYITLSIDEVLKGALWGTEVTIREAGGLVGDRQAWVSANPEFVVGERALLFMDQRHDGTLRTYHFYMGKFTIVTDPASGDAVALRAVPARVTVILPPWTAPSVAAPLGTVAAPLGDVARGLDDFSRLIHEHAFDPQPPTARPRPLLPFVSAAVPPRGTVLDHQEFRFLADPNPPAAVNPNALTPRWLDPDTNTPVTLRISSSGEPSAPSLGFDQVRAAFRAWNRVPTSSFRFAEGPSITGLGGQVSDGINTISFRDPQGQMADPAGCGGILATTWISWTSSGQTTVNGRTFGRALEFDLVTANGWDGCGFYENFSNFTEVLTHELGHALGLGHSADTTSDPLNLGGRSGATMNAFAHFDGRVAGLHADDRAGVTFMYPGQTLTILTAGNGGGTVTSGTDDIKCPGDCVAGFAPNTTVTLTATPAAGSVFSGFTGAGCGTSVAMSTNRTCTATFTAAASAPPTTFGDVPTTHMFFPFIEAVVNAGITGGCSTNPPLYCPDATFTRAEMAVFLLRGIHGATYQPPAATGMFTDVPASHIFARWIEQLAREGITLGCGPTTYCPDGTVTRGQIAVFLVRAFTLPI
jgi:matrixin/List-Bact-rpt repeat protein/S-layer family protein